MMKKSWIVVLLFPSLAWAWGKRGHQIVGETAAILVSDEAGARFMRSRSYDFGYYNNVPDFIWKRPASYDLERSEHFMDMEHFEAAFKAKPDVQNPLALSRADFEKTFPEVKLSSGRAFWRIRELVDQLAKVTTELKALEAPKGKERQKLQERWFILAGTLGHYVADLAMPLHVSENYDGQLTGQKGIHGFFEEDCVDELVPELQVEVHKAARREWSAFKKKNADKSLTDLLRQLTASSRDQIAPLLATDKKYGRKDRAKSAQRHKKMIVQRLAEGSLTLAEIFRRHLGWPFDGERFYFWGGEPEHIRPGHS